MFSGLMVVVCVVMVPIMAGREREIGRLVEWCLFLMVFPSNFLLSDRF